MTHPLGRSPGRCLLLRAAIPGLGLLLLTTVPPPTDAGPKQAHPAKAQTGQTATAQAVPKKLLPETVGEGTVDEPAVGPAPAFGIGGKGMVLVKNWHFGKDGTIKDQAAMNANFVYHDQFNTFNNGFGNYGANTVAPDAADALPHQPVEGVDSPPVRQFLADSLRTYIMPLDGATTLDPDKHNVGCGSFVSKWTLPRGGSLLGRDIVWETRVRYVTPPYYWFALWTAGDRWKWDGHAQGAEHDLVESFGYDNGGGNTNYDGRYWHSNSVAYPARDTVDYGDWGKAMAARGIKAFDPAQYHIWTWLFRKDDTYAMFVDGAQVQSGSDYHWTFGNKAADPPIDMAFLFDGGWGHTQVKSVDHPLPATAFAGKFYEWNYSRVYLSGGAASASKGPDEAAYHGPHVLPGVVQAEDYDTGGGGFGYAQAAGGGQTGYRPDNNGAVHAGAGPGGGGYAVGWSAPGQWYRYTVRVRAKGRYTASFQVATVGSGGKFHLEDETGRDLTGRLTAQDTGGWTDWKRITSPAFTLSAGAHTLRLVEDADGPSAWVCDFDWISLTAA
jgi:hypothetical protein